MDAAQVSDLPHLQRLAIQSAGKQPRLGGDERVGVRNGRASSRASSSWSLAAITCGGGSRSARRLGLVVLVLGVSACAAFVSGVL